MENSTQDILRHDLRRVITEALINTHIQLEKFRRFKIGCEPSECEISELLFLDKIYCQEPCYFTKDHIKTIEQKIKKYGKKM